MSTQFSHAESSVCLQNLTYTTICAVFVCAGNMCSGTFLRFRRALSATRLFIKTTLRRTSAPLCVCIVCIMHKYAREQSAQKQSYSQ